MSLNRVTLLGNLGDSPELRHTVTGGLPVCNMRVATHEYRKKDGESVKETEWHRVSVFGRQAENCAKYLTKGRQVLIEGKLKTRPWVDKEGVTRYTTEVIASNVEFLGAGTTGRETTEGDTGETYTPTPTPTHTPAPTNLVTPPPVQVNTVEAPAHTDRPANLGEVIGVPGEENN